MIKMCQSTFTIHATVLFQLTLNTVSQFLPPGQGQFPFPPPGGPLMMQMPGGAQFPPLPPQMMHAPMSMPMQQRLPVMVMPYYSKSAHKVAQKRTKKKRRVHKRLFFDDSTSSDTSSDTSDSSSSSDFGYRTRKRGSTGNKRHQVLTPVVSYVTKEGYVVYQKKIKKDKAKDWLELGNRKSNLMQGSQEIKESEELSRLKKKLRHSKRKHGHRLHRE